MNTKKVLYYLAGITLLLILVIFSGNRLGFLGTSAAVEVQTEKAERRDIAERVAASGKIFPETEVKISSEVSGEITAILIAEGDSVERGQLLLEINPDIYKSMLERAEATLNQSRANLASSKARKIQAEAQFLNAELTFNRSKKLFEERVISESEFESAQVAYTTSQSEVDAAEQAVLAAEFNIKSAQATVNEARDNLARTSIRSPINGIVSKLSAEPGERVVGTAQMLGTEIMRVADFDIMEVRVEVSESDILRVGVGDSADVEVDAYLNEVFTGVVTRVAQSSAGSDMQLMTDQATNFMVYIRLVPESYLHVMDRVKSKFPFRPGMSAAVEIRTAKVQDVISVPIQSVTLRTIENDEKETEVVFVSENNKAKIRMVKTGIQDDRYIEIKEGLNEGEVIISGPFRAVSRILEEGTEIEHSSEK